MKKMLYYQTQKEWMSDKIGHTNYTLGGSGCLITALSNILFLGGLDVNPKILNQILTNNNGFTDNGFLIWSVFDTCFNCSTTPDYQQQPEFNQQSAVYYIVKPKNQNHFINLLYTINNNLLCFDVFGGNLVVYSANDIDRVIQVKMNQK